MKMLLSVSMCNNKLQLALYLFCDFRTVGNNCLWKNLNIKIFLLYQPFIFLWWLPVYQGIEILKSN